METAGIKKAGPMYHSLLLWRTMQCIELLRALQCDIGDVLDEATGAAQRMLGWLQLHTFSDGTTPAFNDSVAGIAPSSADLLHYAGILKLASQQPTSNDSGYAVIRSASWELMIDAANISPAWQPGHAHADTGTFCLHMAGKPLIVDAGISTYEVSSRRAWERSTAAHNALSIAGCNSSDVWKSFRVGRRARVINATTGAGFFSFSHDGYRPFGINIARRFEWLEDAITITDVISGRGDLPAMLGLHFHPDVQIIQVSAFEFRAGEAAIIISGSSKAWCEPYKFCSGFNLLRPAMRIQAESAHNGISVVFRFK